MKILAVQNRMGIGDMVIFLPYRGYCKKIWGTREHTCKRKLKSNTIFK